MASHWSIPMARKQEKPESTVEAKDTVSTTETSGSQPEDGALSLSSGGAASSSPGELGAPVTDTGPGDSASQVPLEAPTDSGAGSDAASSDLGTSGDLSASKKEALEGADQNGSAVTDGDDEQPAEEDQVAANPNPATLQIYPMRSYMDEGELRRRGGPAYLVPRRHAEELVGRKLAAFEPLKE